MAASSGNLDILNYLISKGANVNARTRGGETPAMKACHFGE